ncbi:transposase [Azospirillum sp. INR13]|nr:transposase [Azospirillum sp. INR13]
MWHPSACERDRVTRADTRAPLRALSCPAVRIRFESIPFHHTPASGYRPFPDGETVCFAPRTTARLRSSGDPARFPRLGGGDRGYALDDFRQRVWTSAHAGDPAKKTDAPVACPAWIYNNRNPIERFWVGIKESRAFATRYEKNLSAPSREFFAPPLPSIGSIANRTQSTPWSLCSVRGGHTAPPRARPPKSVRKFLQENIPCSMLAD